MNHTRTLIGALAAWSMTIFPLTAQANESGPYIAGLGHVTLLDDSRPNLKSAGGGWGGVAGYNLPYALPVGALDIELGYFGTVALRERGPQEDFHHAVNLDGRWRFLNNPQGFDPYVIAGIGGVFEDRDAAQNQNVGRNSSEDWFLMGSVGTGFRVATPFQNMYFRSEARLLAVNNHKDVPNENMVYDGRVSLGLEFMLRPWGGTPPVYTAAEVEPPPPTPPCPPAAPGMPSDAEGCAVQAAAPAIPLAPAPTLIDSDGDGVPDTADLCPNTTPGVRVDAQGCAVAQTIVLQNVQFELGSDQLTSRAKNTLLNLVDSLKGQPGITLEITGHTDSLGPETMNLKLSEERAAAVRNYLIQMGIAAQRLTSLGYGESNPIKTNDTEAGRAANRRVEFRISNGRSAQ